MSLVNFTSSVTPFIRVRDFVVLRDDLPLFVPVSFDIYPGQTLHIKAANGGGKTTLLRSLYGLSIDYQGEVSVHGEPANSALLRSHALYMNDLAGVYGNLTAEENLHYMLLLHALEPNDELCAEALAWAGLQPNKQLLARRLSKGQKKRLHLARMRLLNKPLWLLDEPFDGLDDQGKQLLRDLISERTSAGTTVIFSSHLDAKDSYQSHLLLELQTLA